MPAHAACAEPALDVFLEDGMVLVGMPAASVDYANAGKAGPYRLQQKLLENEARVLQV
jgi:hypothetical protein